MSLLEIYNLKKHFPIKSGLLSRHMGDVKAVDGVTLNVEDGETLGLVGESGCGKTTLGRIILRLIEPTDGKIVFEDREITSLDFSEMRDMRRRMQIIFQDPYASLNPRMRVGEIVGEGLQIHGLATGQKQRDIVMRMLDRVGLREDHYHRYPHEFSGGQRQRIGVARALIFQPRLIIADEPVSALDVSIQAQILNLLDELQREFKLTYIFISHDLRVVEHVSHRVAIMYLGKIVEVGKAETIYADAKHPYTRALLSAVPVPDPNAKAKKNRVVLQGDVPSPINPPSGCSFHPRCRFAEKKCSEVEPGLEDGGDGHLVACHVFGPGASQ
jgi:oligopeptide transport system ATP-binding protein